MAGARGPTLRDVASRAGVSTATVSFVLNGRASVAAETRARVEQALADVGYRMSPSARALRTGRHHAIGLLVPDLANPFFPALAKAVTDAAWGRGHALILASGGDNEAAEVEALAALAERADGIIWIPSGAVSTCASACPTVILDRPDPMLAAYDSISANHYDGGAAVATLLRRLGRRRVGLLTGPATSPSAVRRRSGFLDAAGELSVAWQVEVPFTLDLPDDAAQLLADPTIDAVFAASDVIAIGALKRLRDLGRTVPDEVALVGFDDIPWAALVEPPLTTIRQPFTALGECAVATLMDRIADPDRAPVHHRLPVRLIERASTGQAVAVAA